MPRSLSYIPWKVIQADEDAAFTLQKQLGLHPVIARLLVQRGIITPEDADVFLNPNLSRLHSTELLPDIEPACERIQLALQRKEKILVHGDYDGDGLTSGALWTRFLRSLNADVRCHVPHRKDGYDIRSPIIEQARQEGVSLIITTDCGVTRVDEVLQAREAGIDVIITDHHMPLDSGILPGAIAVINPNRPDSRYPFRQLAGVGVAFKVCEAVVEHLGMKRDNFRRAFLDLAAIGTITDVMPLINENRILVKQGLEALRTTKKVGLSELLKLSRSERDSQDDPISVKTISHGLGPRLGAASRLDSVELAMELLLTKDPQTAVEIAARLDDLNTQRKELQVKMTEEAEQLLLKRGDLTELRICILKSRGWHRSISGNVASRIVEKYSRPCVMIALDEQGNGRGSCRSTSNYNILEGLQTCSDLLQEMGGHFHAAGFSIQGENLDEFSHRLEAHAASLLSEEDIQPSFEAVMELPVEQMTPELISSLEMMEPFGHSNPKPLFISRDISICRVTQMGKEAQQGKHLCLELRAEGINPNGLLRCPWFNHGALMEPLSHLRSIDLLYEPTFNYFRNQRSVQFLVSDVHVPEFAEVSSFYDE